MKIMTLPMRRAAAAMAMLTMLSLPATSVGQTVACKDRLIRNTTFANEVDPTATRYTMQDVDADGVMIDQDAYTYVETGKFSTLNTDCDHQAANPNTHREYAIVKNPKELSDQFADIPVTDGGMLVINPLQGENDQFFTYTASGLKPGETYYIEFKLWNVMDLSPSICRNNWNNWCNDLVIVWEGNGNNAHDGQRDLRWTGTNGSGDWNGHGNQMCGVMKIHEGGSYAVYTAEMKLGDKTTGFTLTFSKRSNIPFVLGVEYFKVYGCVEAEIHTKTGSTTICEGDPNQLIVQGIGPAGSTFTWTKNGGAPDVNSTTNKLSIVGPDSGASDTYTVTGEWDTKSITVTGATCCSNVGDKFYIFKETFGDKPRRYEIPDNIGPYYKDKYQATGAIGDDHYAVVNSARDGGYWGGAVGHNPWNFTDHTPGGGTGILLVNAGASSDYFYKRRLDGLCSGTMYMLEVAYANITAESNRANLRFEVWTEDAVGNRIQQIGKGETGDIPNPGKAEDWHTAEVVFFTPADATSFTLYVYNNNTTGGGGNDLVLDDIFVSRCLVKISLLDENNQNEADVCSKAPYTLSVDAATAKKYYADLWVQWEQSTTGTDGWTAVPGHAASNAASNYTLSVEPTNVNMYYRAKMAGRLASLSSEIDPTDCADDLTYSTVFRLKLRDELDKKLTPAAETLCEGETFVLRGSSTDEVTYSWKYSASGDYNRAIALTGTRPSYSIPKVAKSDEGTYYFVVTQDDCESHAEATLKVTEKPDEPTAKDVVICNKAAATLTATGETGATFTWYVDDETETQLSTGATYTTPVLTASTSYYVKQTVGTCPSDRKEVKITVLATPTLDKVNDQTVCSDEATKAVSLEGTPAGEDVNATFPWTTKTTGTLTGLSTTEGEGRIPSETLTNSGSTNATVTYTVTPTIKSGDTECKADAVTITTTVRPLPQLTGTAVEHTVCDGDDDTINLTGTPANVEFAWTVDADNVSGITSGTASTIKETYVLTDPTAEGSVTYKITPQFTADGVTCKGNETEFATVSVTPIATFRLATDPVGLERETIEIVMGRNYTIVPSVSGGTWQKITPATGDVTIGADGALVGTAEGEITLRYNTSTDCYAEVKIKVTDVAMGADQTIYVCPKDENVPLKGSAENADYIKWRYKFATDATWTETPQQSATAADYTYTYTLPVGIPEDYAGGLTAELIGWREGGNERTQTFTFARIADLGLTFDPAKGAACVSDNALNIKAVVTPDNAENVAYTWGTTPGTSAEYALTGLTAGLDKTLAVSAEAAGTSADEKYLAPATSGRYCKTEKTYTYDVYELKAAKTTDWTKTYCKDDDVLLSIDTDGSTIATGQRVKVVWHIGADDVERTYAASPCTYTFKASETVSVSATVTLVGTDGSDLCQSIDLAKETVSVPAFSTPETKEVGYCVDDPVSLAGSITTTGITGVPTYAWAFGGTDLGVATQTYAKDNFASADAGTYTLTATVVGEVRNCTATQTFNVKQNPDYTFGIEPLVTCIGVESSLTAVPDNTGATGVQYTWTSTGITGAPQGVPATSYKVNTNVASAVSGTVKVSATATGYCPYETEVAVDITDLTVTLTAEDDKDYICTDADEKDRTTLKLGIEGIPAGASVDVAWTKDNNADVISTARSLSVSEAGVYKATVSTTVNGEPLCEITRQLVVKDITLGVQGAPTYTICEGDNIALEGTVSRTGATMEWTLDDEPGNVLSTGNFYSENALKAGRYVYVFTVADGTCKATQRHTVTAQPHVEFSLSQERATACKDDTVEIEATATLPTTGVYFSWKADDETSGREANPYTLPTQKAVTDGVIAVTGRALGYCPTTLALQYGVAELKPVYTWPDYYCPDDEVSLSVNTRQEGLQGTLSQSWSTESLVRGGQTDAAIFAPTGDLEASYTASNEYCTITVSKTIKRVDADLTLNVEDPTVCPGAAITIEAVPSDESASVTWTREDSETLETVTLGSSWILVDAPEHDARYVATLTNHGCENAKEIEVTINPLPVVESVESIEPAPKTVMILASEGTAPYSYAVDDRSNYVSSNIFGDLRIGRHTAYVSDEKGCLAELPFEVEPLPIDFPMYFTPDGNGNHDKWMPSHLDIYEKIDLRIFDRYGKELLKITDPASDGWDGDYLNHRMPSTDYWYTLYIEELHKHYTGHFTLINR